MGASGTEAEGEARRRLARELHESVVIALTMPGVRGAGRSGIGSRLGALLALSFGPSRPGLEP